MSAREPSRDLLWSLMGDLPSREGSVQAEKLSEEDCGTYVLERLVLHLNGLEPVPALFCRAASEKAPVVVYNHAHGGNYKLGKQELLEGRAALQEPPYAGVLAAEGWHSLCLDTWAFGERSGRSESSIFKEMLWKGQVMWGMMVFDTVRATDYLASRPDVDAERIATMGLSMGSTMAWWHAAVDERVKVCIDICCLTDFHELIKESGLDLHGIYYYVPDLLKHFDTTSINALIAPRAHLALAGLQDRLTPVEGLRKVDEGLKKVYSGMNAGDNWKLLTYDVGHQETPEMREEILSWLRQNL